MANSQNSATFQWKRPDSGEFPKIWHTFKARDIDNDNLVEYRIQDLPLDRVDDYYEHLITHLLAEEPVNQALGCADDPYVRHDYKRCWAPSIDQRMALVCLKEGSDEIIGAHLVFISTKGDKHYYDFPKGVCSKSFIHIAINQIQLPTTERCDQRFFFLQLRGRVLLEKSRLADILYADFDPFEKYQVDKIGASKGLSVDGKYRGRGIGAHLLHARSVFHLFYVDYIHAFSFE